MQEEEAHSEMDGCFINNCLKGHTAISVEESKGAIKCIIHCHGRCIDSKMWKLFVKPV